MSSRSLAALAGVFVLAVLALLLFQRAERPRASDQVELIFADFDPAAADSIVITTKQRTVKLKKAAGLWTLAPEGFAADETAIKDLLQKMAGLKRADVASTNPEKAAMFEVDEGGENSVEVTIGKGQQTLARFWVGKLGPDYSSNYLRLDGSDTVLRTKQRIRESFDRGDRTWRERQIFDFDPNAVTAIEFVSPEITGELKAAGEGEQRSWSLDLAGAINPADRQEVDALTRILASLHTDDFPPADTDPAATGLDSPERRVTATLKSGASFELMMGAENDNNQVYARTGDDDSVYLIGKYRIDQIFRTADRLTAEPEPESEPPAAE
jgi:hypothetical protein